jgi:hypothetical protein
MANTLLSPGVQVTVTDQSQYLPAATNSVPLVVIATASNKVSGDGTGIAPGTLAANADQLFLATSQRALSANYGVPFFYQTTNGTPINGYELNEYGLLAAYSALGVTNRCYVLRAAIDLAALTATLVRPNGNPANGSFWLDTNDSRWGLFQWNQTNGTFTNQVPLVITDSVYLNPMSTVPLQSYGSIGQYAVVATATTTPIYFKRGGPTSAQSSATDITNLYNTWVQVGSDEWQTSWATVQGQNTPTSITAGNTFKVNGIPITVPVSPNNTVTGIANAINAASIAGVYAATIGGALNFYADTMAGYEYAISAGTANGTTTSLTFTGAPLASVPFSVGSTITVSGIVSDGVDPTDYNGTFVVTACTTSSVSYANTATDNYVSGGDAYYTSGTINLANLSGTALTTLGLTAGTYHSPVLQSSPSYTVPQWNTYSTSPAGGAPTGSIWQKTNSVNLGTALVVSRYNSTLGTFVAQSCPLYSNDSTAIYGLDPAGGGYNIPATSTYAQYNPLNNGAAGLEIYERYITGPTIVTGSNTTQTFTSGDTFRISATQPGTASFTIKICTINGTTPSDFIAAVSAADITDVSASINSAGSIVFEHSTGGDIYLTNLTGTPITDAGFTTNTSFVRQGYSASYVSGGVPTFLILSNWVGSPTFTYTASNSAPYQDPTTGTYWYYSDPTQVDIMIQDNGVWQGYQNVTSDARGYNLTLTNATGPIISATAPTTQTDTASSPLQYGDLWVSTADLEDYPLLYRWENVSGVPQWVLIDNTNQTDPSGVLFQDARWAPNGVTNPVTDALPTIQSLLTSNYLDLDAPNALLYPQGILMWNTRRSGFNVKTFQENYFNNQSYPTYDWVSTTSYTIGEYVQYGGYNYACILNNTNQTPDVSTTYWSIQEVTNTWLSASGSRPDGAPYMGRQSQRQIIVESLRAAIDNNAAIREEQNYYNLIAVPGYPELAVNMKELNNEINNVAFNIVDTPLRLKPTDVIKWATNNDGLGLGTGDGNLASGDSYSGTFYPSCETFDLSGNTVVTYPSHMMVRTIIRSDEVAYPWLAPAGTRRGIIDNAFQLGYLNGITGVFEPLSVGQALRDVLYPNHINPITFIPGVGIVNFGNLTLQLTPTALDRINVARLVAFIRARLVVIGKQYLFEPNDQITRTEIGNSITSLLLDIVAKRGIYDYLVVCDNTNNTPTTIDQNQLWVDIAIEPVKAVEFIYIPLRIENTGAIAQQAIA